MAPSAPALFSTTTVWPTACDTEADSTRATVSVAEPAGNGTTTRIGLDGNCACAAHDRTTSANPERSLLIAPSSLVLPDPPDIKRGEEKLQPDQRIGRVVPAPHHPEYVAGEEAPEADDALRRRARRDQPGGHDRHRHRRPLQQVEIVHNHARP